MLVSFLHAGSLGHIVSRGSMAMQMAGSLRRWPSIAGFPLQHWSHVDVGTQHLLEEAKGLAKGKKATHYPIQV